MKLVLRLLKKDVRLVTKVNVNSRNYAFIGEMNAFLAKVDSLFAK